MLRNALLIVCLTLAALTAQGPPAAKITIKNFAFDPPALTVSVGTEVEWTDEAGKHSVVADDGSFKSDALTAGGSFKHKFTRPGVFRYYCEFHGSKGGHDMAGTITVSK
jgi:plastocyanin